MSAAEGEDVTEHPLDFLQAALLEAAHRWLDLHPWLEGDPYSSTQNEFLWLAEHAYFEAVRQKAPAQQSTETSLPKKAWGVYQLLDAQDRVLYVGMTGFPQRRIREHLREFGERIARVLWEGVSSRVEAYDLESRLILELQPPMNIAKVPE
jgi:hypothetical protein